VPNAVHAGIYRALRQGYYSADGLKLRVASPSSTADPLKLVAAGKADVGLADPSDVARLVSEGRKVRAILAIVQRPLGGLVARRDSAVRSPPDLEGRRVGVTGVPSDEAVLDTVVRAAGGDPKRVREVRVGFGGVTALAVGRIDAFTGFWPADAPTLDATGHPSRVFALDAHGGPRFPGLVAFATDREIVRRPAVLRVFTDATARGYRETIAHPAAALADLKATNPGLKGGLAARQLAAYRPLFQADAPRFGVLRRAGMRSLTEYLARTGLVKPVPAPGALATERFVP
jgi:NitT/TauT family transport system substrate-binding protein/putative hydroxymethylpyrimidine transport system substrate-binding protein